MAATLTSTGITFSDGTSLNTAFPSADGVGAFRRGIYAVTIPSPGGDGVPQYTNYGAGTTISGGSFACDTYSSGTAGQAYQGYFNDGYVVRKIYPGRTSIGFPGSGSSISGSSNGVLAGGVGYTSGTTPTATFQSASGGALSYNTKSGSWRSMESVTASGMYDGYNNLTVGVWRHAIWQRYA